MLSLSLGRVALQKPSLRFGTRQNNLEALKLGLSRAVPSFLSQRLQFEAVADIAKPVEEPMNNLVFLRQLNAQGLLRTDLRPYLNNAQCVLLTTETTPQQADQLTPELTSQLFQENLQLGDGLALMGAIRQNGLYFVTCENQRYVIQANILPEDWRPGGGLAPVG